MDQRKTILGLSIGILLLTAISSYRKWLQEKKYQKKISSLPIQIWEGEGGNILPDGKSSSACNN